MSLHLLYFVIFQTMHRLLTLTILLVACVYHTMSDIIQDNDWQAWKVFHQKNYQTTDEEHLRYAIWKENLKIIQHHNSKKSSFRMAMNHLGDMVCFI